MTLEDTKSLFYKDILNGMERLRSYGIIKLGVQSPIERKIKAPLQRGLFLLHLFLELALFFPDREQAD